MYKVLLVDDEDIILEGISRIVSWQAAGTLLAGTARNGIEALKFMETNSPDIILSDIRMAGMDGLELVARTSVLYPHIRFIMLSGYGEFDYAQQAMQYGVKHYLLKPCNEKSIEEALGEVTEELQKSERRERFVSNLKQGLEKVMPHVKQQFLKEFVTNKTYGNRDWEFYRRLFNLKREIQDVRLVLFQLEGKYEFEHIFAVQNIAGDLLQQPILSSSVGERVILLLEAEGEADELYEQITRIRNTFIDFYKIDLTAAVSEAGHISRARNLYRETLEYLNHRFYLEEGGLITRSDIHDQCRPELEEVSLEDEQLLIEMKSGHWEEAESLIDRSFGKLSVMRLEAGVLKSYVIQSYMAMIRMGSTERLNKYLGRLESLMEAGTLLDLQKQFKSVAYEITLEQFENKKKKYSDIIGKVLDILERHIADPELSLGRVAHQMLYINPEYLGKLFKKETGEKFSNYVIKLRIKKAVEQIAIIPDIKIFELAEKLGFGDNPQYFSQVFKKFVGCTPSEYIKNPKDIDFLNKKDR